MNDEEHFQRLIELPIDKREAYLLALDAPELTAQLRRLVSAHCDGDSLMSAAEMESTSASFDSLDATIIGPYKLREQIGEGGMGTVYVAEQEKPVRRKVALKIIKAGMDTKSVVARFEAERQALALMDHPSIARVLDAGSTDTGRPYFVMELVRGIPLTEYCDQHNLTVRQRIELFVKVCQAIQHAHQKGIIHRDIKPTNVLVTEHDSVPVPKVIDFGVAKAIGQKLTDKTVYTHHLQPVGTLQYMSPEQSRLSGLDVDTRSDVYSLGLLLYELLTGGLPFDRETFNNASFDEKRRIIAEDEAPKPSTRVSTLRQSSATVTKSRQSDSENLRRELRGEIDWILTKALEKDRNRRYESADRLAEDMQNYLDGSIVLARPPSAVYRLSKTWKRNKAATVMLGLLFLGLLGAAFGWYQSVRREEEAQRRLNIVQDFAMVLAMRGDPRDTEIAVSVCEMSGATQVWSEMLRAQSEMARQDKLPAAIKRLKAASEIEDTHRISCLALLAYAYILDGDSDGGRETAQKLRNVEPRTTTEKIFFGNAFVSDTERCWELANEALRERESSLARFIRAKAAAMQAMNANELHIVNTGLDDLDRVQEVVPETTEQLALRCHLYLAGQVILRHAEVSDHQSSQLADKWSTDGEELVSRLASMPESPPARYVRAWYRDILGTNEQGRAAWMDVLENGSNGWLAYQAATILYIDNDVASARKYLQGDNTMEKLALAAVLSRDPENYWDECLKIYRELKSRNSTAMFFGGFPLEILLDLGELDRLQTDASKLLSDGNRRSDFDQLMLSYFAEPQQERQVLAQLKQFNRLDQLQGHVQIGRHMMVEQPPRIDEAKEQFKKAEQLGVFNSGDYYWAKAYLKLLEKHGTVYVSNEVGKPDTEDPLP